MKILFYKAQYGTWLDKLISGVTFSPYSHCELMFSDNVCGSSSIRDGGVRLKSINIIQSHWDIYDVECEQEESVIRYWFQTYTDEKYDSLGAVFSVIGLNPSLICSVIGLHPSLNSNKWFCSEICGIFTCDKNNLNPGSLYRHLRKIGKIHD